jgi:hypothetical protein
MGTVASARFWRTPVSQGVAFRWLQALLDRRELWVRARIAVVRNEKVRGSNPLSSTSWTPFDLLKRRSETGWFLLQRKGPCNGLNEQ